MTIQQEIAITLASVEDRQTNTNTNYREVKIGLDFILSHLEKPTIFPRTIMTKRLGYQKIVYTKERALEHFIESEFLDCRINAFPNLTEYKDVPRYKPNFLFFDLDRKGFKTQKSFELSLYNTLKDIKEKLNGYPTVLYTGGGYHIYQPVDIPTALENIAEFQDIKRASEQFLRFAKDYLSNNKADKQNNPSFKSCLLRIPGSINSKYNKPVKIIKKWNRIRAHITRDFLEEFRAYLIQKKIDQNTQRRKIFNERTKNKAYTNQYHAWIEDLLHIPIEDFRKLVIDLILSPYLINVRKLSYQESYIIIRNWLDRCNDLKILDNDRNFEYRINYALKNATNKQIRPMSQYKIRGDSNYNKLYTLLKKKEILKI